MRLPRRFAPRNDNILPTFIIIIRHITHSTFPLRGRGLG